MLRFFLLATFTFFSYSAIAAPYESNEWLTLLHFKNGKSFIDDPKFFLTETGKNDARAEYEATIKAIQSDNFTDINNHAICKYPARVEFILKNNNIALPKVECSEYEEFRQTINPKSITLVFPFLYVNRPASMFGHTLLRINNSYNEPLLAHGVTFLADASKGENPLAFMFKGLFGFYEGYFVMSKYYETIFQYNNIDKRDIWEYDLNFTKEESVKLFNHLWELKNIYTDYYFFDENCSYHLMFLLQSARPSLNLTETKPWVIPADAVKKVHEKGLVKKVNYRPSHSVVINSIARTMPKELIDISKTVAIKNKSLETITESDYSDRLKVSMLDLAIEYLRYDSISNVKDNSSMKEYRDRTISILTARSKYKLNPDYKIDKPMSPHLGHDSIRAKAAVGAKDNFFFTEVGLRLAYHSLDDIDDGYVKNAQTEMLGATIRYENESDNVYIEDVTLLSVVAYLPMNNLFKPLSWAIAFGGERRLYKNDEKFVAYAQGSIGATFDFIGDGTIFTMLKGDVSSFYGLALGANIGYSIPYQYGKFLLEGEYLNYAFNEVAYSVANVKVGTTIKVTQNNAINLYYSRETAFKNYSTEIGASWFFYF